MQIVDKGSGPPLILIPGIQGRWQYCGPTIDALSPSFRVITFPLRGEPGSGAAFDSVQGADTYVDQIVDVLDGFGIDRAIVCAISFGGLIALRFAAHQPDRVSRLILASTPGPSWHLSRRHELYARAPRLFGPPFVLETPWRVRAEVRAALPDGSARWAFARRQLRTFVGARLSFRGMAQRARLVSTLHRQLDCSRIGAPTLIVTGERALDRVVSVEGSLEYLQMIRDVHHAVIERTGHLGSLTRPDEFAEIVKRFVATREAEHGHRAPHTSEDHAA